MRTSNASKIFNYCKRSLLLTVFAGSISICFGQAGQPPSDPPPPLIDANSPSVTLTFADGSSLALRSRKGRFSLAALNPGETVNIKLRVPSLNVVAAAGALDGGVVSAGAQNIILGSDGIGSFQYRIGTQPGRYRVVISSGTALATLQFWVTDPKNPQSNPAASQAQ